MGRAGFPPQAVSKVELPPSTFNGCAASVFRQELPMCYGGNRDEFDALIKRLEPFAEKYPRAYFARVVLLAALGYAFWLVVLGGLAAIVTGLGILVARFSK